MKGRTLDGADGRPSDWFGRRLATIAFDEPRELFQRFAAMLKTGVSYPLEQCDVRDGTYQPDDLFLVYESADLQDLRALVDAAIAVAGSPETPAG